MNEDKVLNKTDVINQIRESIKFINKNLNEDISIFKMDDSQLDTLYYYLDIIVNNIKYKKEN